jgi:restriction endonuclease S subunit
MINSIIQKSQLEGQNRLDAEYYQPEYLEVGKKLSKSIDLNGLAEQITDFGAYSQMNFVNFIETGIRFFKNQDIDEFFINDNDQTFISKDVYDKLSLKLDEFDIVTPRVGTLGNSAVILKENLPATANQNLAQIKPDLSKIDPIYLSIFLCSDFGRKQFERAATGNVQPWLNLIQIKSLKVFVPSKEEQHKIRRIGINSLKQKREAADYYQEAENLLLKELGLKDFKVEDNLFFMTKLSEVKSVNRMDTDYFQPKYQKLVGALKNSKRLGELATLKKGFEPGSDTYQDEGKRFIRVSNMTKESLNGNDQKYLSEETFDNYKLDYQPKVGEILLTKDASPGIAYVLKEEMNGIISSGILRLKVKEKIDTEYLSLCINSIVGKMQAERDAGGSIINHWRPDQIKDILIPVLPDKTQEKIADFVRKSHEFRKKAKDLLEEAKRKVEELIEKGETNYANRV